MNDFKHWKEITRGLYRYIISAKVCYEIHILYFDLHTDILCAKASLFLVGEWNGKVEGTNFFQRECLLREQPVFECLNAAVRDEAENNI